MRCLYVAGQNAETREWVPVAELREVKEGYELRYTRGARRLAGFSGLGRMQSLDKAYYSRTLFPFFSNRLLSKSRPEYKSYLRWLGTDGLADDAMDVLSVTGGVRATDGYELVAVPDQRNGEFRLDFFPRGLRYLPASALAVLMEQAEGSPAYLMKDVQNPKDPHALALRTETPSANLIGYVPRYYCQGITKLLDDASATIKSTIKRVNADAPLDMKLLISLTAKFQGQFELLSEVDDFKPLTSEQASGSYGLAP